MVNDFESQLIFGVVDRANIGELVKGRFRRIVQIARKVQQARGGHGERSLRSCRVDVDCEDRVREFGLKVVE